MRVLSFDPGFERLGAAILESAPRGETLIHSECVRTRASLPFEGRLLVLGAAFARLAKTYEPDAIALETLLWGSNRKTAMRVAEVRGVLLYLAALRNLPLFEYTPLQVKVAVAGHGRADKAEVARMVATLLRINAQGRLDDEIDAIAVGITCLARERSRKFIP